MKKEIITDSTFLSTMVHSWGCFVSVIPTRFIGKVDYCGVLNNLLSTNCKLVAMNIQKRW